jgi:hypothetical protein
VWFFNIAGGVCLALASLAAYLGQPKYGITLTVLGLFCLGVAQIVGLVWFKYAVFGLGVVGFIALVAAIIYNYNKHEAHKAVDEEATDYYDVLIKLIPVFDKAYETATPEMQKWLEETILVKLGRAYNDKDKALIHTIRADVIKLRGKTGS